MINQQNNDNQDEQVIKASYLLGHLNALPVKFEFTIPVNLSNYLFYTGLKIDLLDANLAVLSPSIETNTTAIPWITFNTTAITTIGFLYFEIHFVINGTIEDTSLLEKYLKKCKTVYRIRGGQEGAKVFYLNDSAHITADKDRLILRKHITLNR